MHSNVAPGTAGTTAGQTTLAWIPRLASRVCSMDSAVRKVSTFVLAPVVLDSPLVLDGDSCEDVVREVPPHPTVASASAAAHISEARKRLVRIDRAYTLYRVFLRRPGPRGRVAGVQVMWCGRVPARASEAMTSARRER